MLDAFYAKKEGERLGGQFANTPPNKNEDFETLRQLMVIFPRIELTYGDDFEKIRERLKFQLAMWLGDTGNSEKQRIIVDDLLPVINNITSSKTWKMYKNLVQTMIAEFKLQGG